MLLRVGCILALLTTLLLSACAPARYVVVSEEMKDLTWDSLNQRFICLTSADARDHQALLQLRKKSAVKKYAEHRRELDDPVETVLFHMLREDYPNADVALHRGGNRIPAYLRLLLDADLHYERRDSDNAQLARLYQAALDEEACGELTRAIIKLRIRQLRYRR